MCLNRLEAIGLFRSSELTWESEHGEAGFVRGLRPQLLRLRLVELTGTLAGGKLLTQKVAFEKEIIEKRGKTFLQTREKTCVANLKKADLRASR